MPEPTPVPISPPPGVVLTETDKVIVGRYTGSTMCRFRRGRLEKRGGWAQISGAVYPGGGASAVTFGTPRASLAWRDNSGNSYFAVGTYAKLYVYDPSWLQNDITPFKTTGGSGTLGTNPFATQSSSTLITVTHTNHGEIQGDFVIFAGATTFNGVTLNGEFQIVNIVDANHYQFNAPNAASGTGSGGGSAVTFEYEIDVGVELGAFGYGWGIGGWGLGTWGTSRTNSTFYIEPRVWSLDHFGKYLVATSNQGQVWLFDPTQVQPWPRAILISSQAPTDARALFVTPEDFIIVLRQNMVISGCNQGDFTTWTPATNNTAFTRTLAIGTKLVAGRVLAPFISLIWSDSAIYMLEYTGSAFVYNSQLLASKCGLIGAGAAVTAGGVAYWMSPDNFWMYDGSVHVIPNVEDIRRFVFNTLNINNSYQCTAVYNPILNEVEWFYTPNGATNPTLSVTYDINDQSWAPHNWAGAGLPARASGASFDQGDTRPVMAGTDGLLYQHENGVDANGSPLPYSWQIARWPLGGNSRVLSEMMGLEPDFNNFTETMTLTVASYDRLYDSGVQTEPLETDSQVISANAESYLDYRIDGRYIQVSGTSSDLGGFFRMGAPTAFLKPIGLRP